MTIAIDQSSATTTPTQTYLYYCVDSITHEIRLTGFVSASSRREARRRLRLLGFRA